MSDVKYYYIDLVDDDKKIFKITCKHCNGYIQCAEKSGEMLYINFIHTGMTSLGLSPEEIYPDNFFF